jgi:hypothetical protein
LTLVSSVRLLQTGRLQARSSMYMCGLFDSGLQPWYVGNLVPSMMCTVVSFSPTQGTSSQATVDDGSPWPNAASWAVLASSDHFVDGGTEYMGVGGYYEYG